MRSQAKLGNENVRNGFPMIQSGNKRKGKWKGVVRFAACSLFLFPFVLVSGCRSCERVEAELRARENEVRELKEELARSEAINEGFMREQGMKANSSSKVITPEYAAHTTQIKEVVLGRQTGGYDEDDCPGDEGLQVVLEPRDSDGHAIKAPGALQVSALEIQTQGVKTPLSTWDIPPENLRRTWKSGLLSTGYYIHLPWKNWPSVTKLRVVARFTLADGRFFEADKDVTIRPTKNRKPDAVPPGSPLPDEDLPLPLPRKAEPSSEPESRIPTQIDPLQANPVERTGIWQATTPASSGPAQLLPPNR